MNNGQFEVMVATLEAILKLCFWWPPCILTSSVYSMALLYAALMRIASLNQGYTKMTGL